MNEEEGIQQKYVELKVLNEQIKQIHKQKLLLDQQLIELQKLNESLEEVKKEGGKQIFVSLGGGIFMESEIKDVKQVLVNVGDEIFVKKPVLQAKELVNEQMREINNMISVLASETEKGAEKLQKLHEEFEKLNKE